MTYQFGFAEPDTVEQLIELLKTFPEDAKVVALWEGTCHTLRCTEYNSAYNVVEFDVEHDWLTLKS